MKKFIFLSLLLVACLNAQTHFDIPHSAQFDTVTATTTTAYRDFFFNSASDSSWREVINSGALDLNVLADMWSTNETTDTITVKAVGLTTKKLEYSPYVITKNKSLLSWTQKL